MTNNIHKELSYYESLYQCLCCSFSEAYLKGSKWYVGERLTDWFYNVEGNFSEFRSKFEKYGYIKEILDIFITNDIEESYGNEKNENFSECIDIIENA